MDLSFLLRVFRATARAAPPWATLAAEARGSQKVRPYWPNCPRSMMVYMWWMPETTVVAYRPPMTKEPMPRGMAMSHCTPLMTKFSTVVNTGPMAARVR